MKGPITDVVGAQEARQILGVELQRISRWRKAGRLPEPYADLRLSPVWVRKDIERIRDTGKVNGATKPPAESPLVGTAEAAKMLDVDKSQIARWRSRPTKSGPSFPEPVARIKAGPLWGRGDVEEFAKARARGAAVRERSRESAAQKRAERAGRAKKAAA